MLLTLLLALHGAPAISIGARAYDHPLFAVGLSASQTTPQCSKSASTATGFASYYSNTFDGQKTASGETFHNSQLVAAHRSFPFGTIVCVTRLDDKKTVQVRIIDRGPFGSNRKKGTIIDLSRAAARQLDMLEKGLVRVRVDVVKWGPEQK